MWPLKVLIRPFTHLSEASPPQGGGGLFTYLYKYLDGLNLQVLYKYGLFDGLQTVDFPTHVPFYTYSGGEKKREEAETHVFFFSPQDCKRLPPAPPSTSTCTSKTLHRTQRVFFFRA